MMTHVIKKRKKVINHIKKEEKREKTNQTYDYLSTLQKFFFDCYIHHFNYFVLMGNRLSTLCLGGKKAPRINDGPRSDTSKKSPPPISVFYQACRRGDAEQVQQLLPSMTLDEINKIESNGSTALHVACYYGHSDIVKLLLDAGASRSIRNKHNMTPFDESNAQIKNLFYRVNSTNNTKGDIGTDRFTGLSVHNEWMVETKQAAEWKINLYNWLKIEQSFDEVITFLQQHYLIDHVFHACQSEQEKNIIEWFFHQAVVEQDVRYIVKAYTSMTQFYTIVNNHLREFLLRFFRWDYDARHTNTLEKSVGYLASIFIYHPDLRSLSYTGLTYRGMKLSRDDLSVYTVGKRLLNKSFLSTSTDRQVAEMFAGEGASTNMRRNLNHDLLEHITFCTYKIKNPNTALNIGLLSVAPVENEVLIMPLCAFQVKSIKQHLGNDSRIHVEIELEECDSSSTTDINQSTESVSSNRRPRIV
jgi:hypothetical protein